jgi:cyclopropane-fatty-acyl-phospholipid synthase
MLNYLLWGSGLLVLAYLAYRLVTWLFAKQLVLGYLHSHSLPLEKMIKVHNECLWPAMLKSGSMGLGEGYMFGWYTCEKMEEMLTLLVRSTIFQVARPRYRLEAILYNLQSITRSVSHVQHYNIGNDLYSAMLGVTMQYTCGWWENIPENDLDAAQEKKLDMICKKLNLKPGMRVVDIGCGWGYLMHYMVKHYNVKVVGVSISTEQI